MSEVTYYFDSYDVAEAWFFNPENLVDGNIATHAGSNTIGKVQSNNSNTCPGTHLGTISKVEIRVHGTCGMTGSGYHLYRIRPEFTAGDGDNHNIETLNDVWSSWKNITADTNAPASWSWTDVQNLQMDIEVYQKLTLVTFADKIEIRVTYSEAPPPNPYPTGLLKKGLVSGFHCFLSAYILAKIAGYDPLKLPDGTLF